MRIKHLIFIAAVAIVTASCAHSFQVQETQQPAIGFGTWAEQLTKARTPGSNEFVNEDDFAVFGFYTKEGNTTVFDNQTVSYNGTTWSYSPLRFWDPTASSYTFFAISPASYGVAGSYAQNGLFTSANEITFAGNDNDILVAEKKVVAAAESTPKYPSTPVEMDFNHIASLVDVRVKMDASLASALISNFSGSTIADVPTTAGLMITDASLVNIQKKGNFAVYSYDGDNKPVIGTTTWGWTLADPQYVGDYVSPVSENHLHVTANTQYSSHVENEDPDVLGQNLFTAPLVLMPQQLLAATQKLHIEYEIITQETPTVVKTTYSANIDIKDFITTDRDDNTGVNVPAYWAPGTHYIYTLTIGANAITFTAQINAWEPQTPVNGYHYLVN